MVFFIKIYDAVPKRTVIPPQTFSDVSVVVHNTTDAAAEKIIYTYKKNVVPPKGAALRTRNGNINVSLIQTIKPGPAKPVPGEYLQPLPDRSNKLQKFPQRGFIAKYTPEQIKNNPEVQKIYSTYFAYEYGLKNNRELEYEMWKKNVKKNIEKLRWEYFPPISVHYKIITTFNGKFDSTGFANAGNRGIIFNTTFPANGIKTVELRLIQIILGKLRPSFEPLGDSIETMLKEKKVKLETVKGSTVFNIDRIRIYPTQLVSNIFAKLGFEVLTKRK